MTRRKERERYPALCLSRAWEMSKLPRVTKLSASMKGILRAAICQQRRGSGLLACLPTAREERDLVFDEAKLQQSSLVGSLLVETRVEHGVGFRNVYNTARASQTNTYGSS